MLHYYEAAMHSLWLTRERLLDTLSVLLGFLTVGWGVDLIVGQNRFNVSTYDVVRERLAIPVWGTVFIAIGAALVIGALVRPGWRVATSFVAVLWWSLWAIATTIPVFRAPPPPRPGYPDPVPAVPLEAWYGLTMMSLSLLIGLVYLADRGILENGRATHE